MKLASDLKLIKSTLKARLFERSGFKFWVSNRAVIQSKKIDTNSYEVVVEDWAEVPESIFIPITLMDLVKEPPPPKIEYTTAISDSEFPDDLIKIQEEAVAFAIKLKIALIWLWTGCGKTKIGIEIANILFKNNKAKRLIWITPPRGIEQVERSFVRWLNPNIKFEIVSVNWFSYYTRDDIGEHDIVVIDEAHRVKNSIADDVNSADCQLAENIRKSIYNAGFVYGLTANLSINGELDLFGIFYTIKKDIVMDKGSKIRQYIKYKDNTPISVKSLPDLIRRTSSYTFHRNKHDYDNRRFIDKVFALKLNSEQSALMNRLYRMADKAFKETLINSYSAMIKALHQAGGSVKMQKLLEVLSEIPNDDQVIIFGFTVTDSYSDLALIKDVCKQSGRSYISLNGQQTELENNLAIDNFRKGKFNILISSYGSGAEMLDFPNANHVIFFGHSLNPVHRFQAKGRIDRVIQKKQCYSYLIYVENSVEGYVNAIYNRKMNFTKDLSDYFKIDDFKILNNYDEQLS